MAIIPETKYAGKITPSSPQYPYGQARNITLPGDGTGTPWEAALVNDIFGFQQEILTKAGIVPTGDPEEVGDSQYAEALDIVHGVVVGSVAEGFGGRPVVEGKKYSVPGWAAGSYAFASGTTRGGGMFVASASASKDDHDGVTVISPTVPKVSEQAGGSFQERRDNFLNGAGETDPGGTGAFVRLNVDALTLRAGGAVGDGTVDDTVAVLAVAAKASKLIGFRDDIYLMTDELLMSEDQEIDLNGAELRFNSTGQTKCVELKSGCVIHRGKVNNLNTTAQGGDFQTPVQVGDTRTSFTIENWKIENLVIENATPNGNGVAAWGNSSGGVIRNILFPQTSTIGRPIILHWGSLGVLPVAETFHVHGVLVENIICRGLSITGASDAAAVFLSAVYNVEVRNVYCFDLPEGDIVRVFAGDYGYQYAQTTNEIDLAGQGIKIKNIFGRGEKAVQIGMNNPDGDITKVWPASIEVSGVGARGYGGVNTLSNGIDVSQATNVRVHDCELQGFFANFFVGGGASRLSFKDNKSRNPVSKGFDCRFDSSNIKIKDNDFEGSPDYDIFLGTCQHVMVKGNTYDSPAATNNVRLDGGASAPVDVKIIENTSEDVSAAGPAFSLGSTSDDKICTLFRDNTVVNVPTNGIVAGQRYLPVTIGTSRQNLLEIRECYGDVQPTAGAWNLGDKVWAEAPTTDANNMTLVGWVCTSSGSPGTWQPMYVSAVSPAA